MGIKLFRFKILGIFVFALFLTACSEQGLGNNWSSGVDSGFVLGDGTITEIPEQKRSKEVEYSGTGIDGVSIDQSYTQGNVSVINFWYAGCAPCRAEASDLESSYQKFSRNNVKFLGVNTRDQKAQASEFHEEFKVSYPSIIDMENSRKTQQAFAKIIPLNAVPTTLILDSEGRVAARILGQVPSEDGLNELIEKVLAEK